MCKTQTRVQNSENKNARKIKFARAKIDVRIKPQARRRNSRSALDRD
jgi:hypothetical protein